MHTERRALTADEARRLAAPADMGQAWPFLVLGSVNMGIICTLAFLGLAFLIEWTSSITVEALTGSTMGAIGVLVFSVASASTLVLLRARTAHAQREDASRRARLLDADDLLIEYHDIADCKLVREPEHGQPMFFARCEDGRVVFVFEGQDDLDDDWSSRPEVLRDDEKPRRTLKIVRNPKTGDCELLHFEGDELPVSECKLIALRPEQWPSNGKVVSAPWSELERRYRLRDL